MATHKILGGKVQLFTKPESTRWYFSTSIKGKRFRKPTHESSLQLAKEVAEDWYFKTIGEVRAGLPVGEETFKEAAAIFEKEYEVSNEGHRSPKWIKGHSIRLRLHLTPYFSSLGLSQVTAGKIQEYRLNRTVTSKETRGKTVSRSTLHDEICTLRLVLKSALRRGKISHLPDLSTPYRASGKIEHRPWFTPEEYKQLYTATREYAKNPAQQQIKWNAEQMHDYVLFMGNTGLRPDEVKNLQHRDIKIVDDEATGERILEIIVHGKRGVGYCKSLPGAVNVYERLRTRPTKQPLQTQRARRRRGEKGLPAPIEIKYPQLTDNIFPGNHIKLFNNLLDRINLKFDREGKARTAYSLRHTYICMRLMEGADVYHIAKNCRTSVEMIEKHYAAHLKHTLDASQINVMRPQKRKNKPKTDDSKNNKKTDYVDSLQASS